MSRGGERITKVFLDSRLALDDGSLQIPGGGLVLDRSNRVWLGEFSTVASWDTIDSTNNKMYIIERLNGVAIPRIVEITQGPHDLDTLAASLQSSLNGAGKMAGLGTYYVTRVGAGDSAASGVLARAYQVDLSNGAFRIPPDVDVQSSFDVPLVDPRSLSKIFSFPLADFAGSAKSGFVDLRRCHQIFIHTPGFGNYNSLGPSGERDILAKVPVDVGYGGAIHWYMSGSEHDSVECGVTNLTVLKVILKDVDGRELNPRGGHWSATLIFDK